MMLMIGRRAGFFVALGEGKWYNGYNRNLGIGGMSMPGTGAVINLGSRSESVGKLAAGAAWRAVSVGNF